MIWCTAGKVLYEKTHLGMSLHQWPLPSHHNALALLINQLIILSEVLHPLLQVAAVGGLRRACLALNCPQDQLSLHTCKPGMVRASKNCRACLLKPMALPSWCIMEANVPILSCWLEAVLCYCRHMTWQN